MSDYLTREHLVEEKDYLEDIPIIRFNLKDNKGKVPTIIMYHGWSSNKESQRLRGFILANLGFQVIIPDGIHHGERNRLEDYDGENTVKYFWPTIINNMEEADKIIHYCIEHYNADSSKIGVIGHSMGGFTAAGVFSHNKRIKTAVVLNGSFNWHMSNEIFKSHLGFQDYKKFDLEEKIDSMDPMNKKDSLVDRPILLLHGSADNVVNIESQRAFYNNIRPMFSDQNLIQFMEYNNLGHFVTTNMMDEAAAWFRKWL